MIDLDADRRKVSFTPEELKLLRQTPEKLGVRNLHGYDFVLTGSMSMTRKNMTEFIAALGGRVLNAPLNSGTMVIVADPAKSRTGKTLAAARLGCRIFTEPEFVQWVESA